MTKHTSMKKRRLQASVAALVMVAAGCGSSAKAASGGGGHTFTIGLLVDQTGLAASGNKTGVQGVQAGVVLAKREGYTIKFDVADTTSTPSGALTAAQKLVEQDHVFAVVAVSALTFGAADYLKSRNIPVLGLSEDADEWSTDMNMFSTGGALHEDKVITTFGKFFKMEGVTTVGSLGYGISPSSSENSESAAKSAQDAGINVGYLNAKFPFGGTNVGPAVLAMKNAHVDGFWSVVDPNTGFALVAAMRQAGVDLKVALMPTGYGGDLLQAGPGALREAQDVYFLNGVEPVEMHTAATKQLMADVRAVGISGDPTFAEYQGYLSVGLLLQGLKGAGADPTQASLITSLSKIHNWDALGLWGGRTVDINDRTGLASGVDNCFWIVKLVGSNFDLVPGADPICGSVVAGQTVKPAS